MCRLPVLTAFLIGMSIASSQSLQINYDILLGDKQYVETQLACVLGKKLETCDKIGNRIRTLLPQNASTGKCPQCNDQEKIYTAKVAEKLKKEYPAQWQELLDLYKVPIEIRDTFFQGPL